MRTGNYLIKKLIFIKFVLQMRDIYSEMVLQSRDAFCGTSLEHNSRLARHACSGEPFHHRAYLPNSAWIALFLLVFLFYPFAGYYYFNYLWFPFLVCWSVKWIILKYGGIRGYRAAVPLFLGLVLGDFVLGCIWTILGLLQANPHICSKNW